MRPPELAPGPVVLDSVATLLRGATAREPLVVGAGKSGAAMERVTIGDKRYVVKHLDLRRDWTMRAAGMLRSVPGELWRRGLLHRLPDCIEQPIVAVVYEPGGVTVLLMRDVGDWLVPVDDDPVRLDRTCAFSTTWPRCTPRSGRPGRRSTSCRRCTATSSCPCGPRRRRRPWVRSTWCPG